MNDSVDKKAKHSGVIGLPWTALAILLLLLPGTACDDDFPAQGNNGTPIESPDLASDGMDTSTGTEIGQRHSDIVISKTDGAAESQDGADGQDTRQHAPSQDSDATEDVVEVVLQPPCDDESFLGFGTKYTLWVLGNCGFTNHEPEAHYAAVPMDFYDDSAACGACVEVAGPLATIRVPVVDSCNSCPQGNLDLSETAYAAIAQPNAPLVPINWRVVPCAVEGPIEYYFKPGSNEWWMAVQIRNHRHPIARVQVQYYDGLYYDMIREDYNFFVAAIGVGPGPYGFKVTDVHGNVLEDANIPAESGTLAYGQGQFPACDPPQENDGAIAPDAAP